MTLERKIGFGFAVITMAALVGAAVSVGAFVRAAHRLEPIAAQFLPAGRLASAVERGLLNARIHFIYQVTIQKEGEKDRGWEYLRSAEAEMPELERLVRSSPALSSLVPQVDALRRDLAEYRPVLVQIIQAVDEHQNTTPEFAELRSRWAALGDRMVASAAELSAEAGELASGAGRETAASLSLWGMLVLAGGCGMMLLSVGAIMAARRIGRALATASATIAGSAIHITNTAASLSGSAQSSAQRASQQAASVEETSAAAHEISSMASQNVDHARQAAEFTREVGHDSDAASAALAELVQAMTSIAGSAKSISGVLRIIDELAFQTNILALNAAVEAARAGEAGAGFAVVADEVRSLAQRSASASRDTSALVDQSMESVSAGQERLHRVDEALRRIVEKIGKLGAHVSDVANSSSEQTNGLTQISTAIEQIERGVQESAASAEERVAASEELTSHARLLRTTAVDLADMMGTTGG